MAVRGVAVVLAARVEREAHGSFDLDQNFGTSPGDNVRDDVEALIGTPHPDTLNGGVGNLAQTISGIGGNDTLQGGGGTDVFAVHAICTVETRDHAHVAALRRALRKQGFPTTAAREH